MKALNRALSERFSGFRLAAWATAVVRCSRGLEDSSERDLRNRIPEDVGQPLPGRLAGVQPHPHPDVLAGRPRVLRQSPLSRDDAARRGEPG